MMGFHIEGIGKPEGCKLIRVSADLEDGVIRSISIRGDFFASPAEGFDRIEARLTGVAPDEAGPAFDRFLIQEGVEAQGISGEGLAQVIRSALQAEEGSGK
jgi:hypothetical protein